MYFKVRMLMLSGIASVLFTGCASYFYSEVSDSFTSNAETQVLDNQNYEQKLQKMVDKTFPKSDTDIVSDHFDVLIAGQVNSQQTKDGIVALIKEQSVVRDVYDYTTIMPKPSYHTSSSVVSAVTDRLKKEPDIAVERLTITYVDSVVYLMGTNVGNLAHLARAVKGLYAIEGVKKVVNLVKPGPADYYSGK